MNKSRKLKLYKNYMPIPTNVGDEIYPNGIFDFNISKMLEHITAGKLDAKKELINVSEWFKTHIRGSVNEDHLPMADITKPVLQVEIRPGVFEIIDGNHRIEKACRNDVEFINSYKLKGEQLKMLKSLGIREQKAWEYANTRKSYWRTSNSPILSKSLTNNVIRGFGFLFFSEYYRQVTA